MSNAGVWEDCVRLRPSSGSFARNMHATSFDVLQRGAVWWGPGTMVGSGHLAGDRRTCIAWLL